MKRRKYTITKLLHPGEDIVWMGDAASPQEAMQAYNPKAEPSKLKRDADYQVFWMEPKTGWFRRKYFYIPKDYSSLYSWLR